MAYTPVDPNRYPTVQEAEQAALPDALGIRANRPTTELADEHRCDVVLL